MTPTNEAGHGLPELAAPAARNTPHPPAAASASERAWEILSLHAATNVRWVTTVQALAALEQALTQQRGECEALWCLHILGPDDVHPAPSKAHAEKAAERLNAFMESRKDRHPLDPECHAVAAPWPHSPESHAESVERFIAEWLTPNTPQPAAADGGVRERARAVELANEWRHALTNGNDGHELCANWNTIAQFVNAIDALTTARSGDEPNPPLPRDFHADGIERTGAGDPVLDKAADDLKGPEQ